jgi:hypothetical protein
MDLLSLLSEIPDPRRRQGQMYSHVAVVLFSILAMLAGATSYRRIYGFIAIHLAELNAAFPTVALRRAPSYCSIRYILQKLDPEAVERAVRRHAASLCGEPDEAGPAVVAIDGKTLRGSFDAFADRKAAHLLSAFAIDNQIILGHLPVPDKSNEIPAAQALIVALGLTGRLFTLDAMHCQKNVRGSVEHRQ